VLRPGGRLVVVDLAPHDRAECIERLAHRWPGFSDADMHDWFTGAGILPPAATALPGAMDVRIWSARTMATQTHSLTELESAR
jgi:ArsR family transcriptional regulator